MKIIPLHRWLGREAAAGPLSAELARQERITRAIDGLAAGWMQAYDETVAERGRYKAAWLNARGRAWLAEQDARNLRIERDAAHREVADRIRDREAVEAEMDRRLSEAWAERDEALEALDGAISRARAARAELDAFAATPIPDGFSSLAVFALVHVTAPFIERMRAALGGAQ